MGCANLDQGRGGELFIERFMDVVRREIYKEVLLIDAMELG
jgi:hypothetical protein